MLFSQSHMDRGHMTFLSWNKAVEKTGCLIRDKHQVCLDCPQCQLSRGLRGRSADWEGKGTRVSVFLRIIKSVCLIKLMRLLTSRIELPTI